MAPGQPPRELALGLGELPKGGQGQSELPGAGAGQRAEAPENEPARAGLGQRERSIAADQELPGPAGQQRGQRRVADRERALLPGQIVAEVIQHDQVRIGRIGRQGGRGRLAAQHGDHPLGLEPAHPRRDLGREGRLADTAHAVQHERGHARPSQLGGPAPPFGRPDGQGGGPRRGWALGGPGVPGGVRGPGGRDVWPRGTPRHRGIFIPNTV